LRRYDEVGASAEDGASIAMMLPSALAAVNSATAAKVGCYSLNLVLKALGSGC